MLRLQRLGRVRVQIVLDAVRLAVAPQACERARDRSFEPLHPRPSALQACSGPRDYTTLWNDERRAYARGCRSGDHRSLAKSRERGCGDARDRAAGVGRVSLEG